LQTELQCLSHSRKHSHVPSHSLKPLANIILCAFAPRRFWQGGKLSVED
jgi:hypothetical protein